jgi:transposase
MDESMDLRERVVRTVKAGLSRRTAARRLEVSISFVQHWNRHGTVGSERYGTRSAVMVASPTAPALLGGA